MNEFLLELIDLIKTGEWYGEGDLVLPGHALLIDLEGLAAKIRDSTTGKVQGDDHG